MKKTLSDFAFFGGAPLFPEKLHVGRPNLGDRARLFSRLEGMLDRRWLTNHGVLVAEFERKVADIAGAKHCIATCNATVALELAIRAAGLQGEVIVPSFTFVATAHALQWQEITPVFCDVDPVSHTIDPAQIERLITPRTTGILGVHLWGRPCAIDELSQLAKTHNLTLLFDAAHAFGCTYHGQPIGRFGRASIYSFHATKFLNTGEGGAIVTDDDALAHKIRLMANFGFVDFDKVIYVGTNGKMPEASAAMGLTNLEAMEEFVATNRGNHMLYTRLLGGIPGIRVMSYDPDEDQNYQYVVAEVDALESRISRDQLVQLLLAENVVARRYFYPGVHRMEPYRSYYPNSALWLPKTEWLARRVLVLPTGTGVSHGDIEKICGLIRSAVELGADIHALMAVETDISAGDGAYQRVLDQAKMA
jgi:dTDP-4-amino-4,6-dideoxygalactose transaminase